MIFVIDDDLMMAKCIARAVGKCGKKAQIFSNAIEAMGALSFERDLPEMIFLDILLTGPDGFSFLNEILSYPDTAKIPVVIVSSLDFGAVDFSDYGVVGVLNKEKMLPSEVIFYVEKYAK